MLYGHLLQLELEEDDGVLQKSSEDKDDAGNHPTLDRCEAFSLKIIDDEEEEGGDLIKLIFNPKMCTFHSYFFQTIPIWKNSSLS